MSDRAISYKDLSHTEQQLVDTAWQAAKMAYCPYSNFPVGSAILTEDGTVFSGCNVENASWSPSICSERVAVSKAVSEGHRQFKAIAIVCASKPGSWPCGMCRQFLREFGLQLQVLNIVNNEGSVIKKSLNQLLPDSFGPDSL